MKKLAILTSILALTACGGGSGSGGSAPIMPDAPVVPDAPTPDVPDAPTPDVPDTPTPFVDLVAQSNSVITNIISNSEYQATRYVEHKLGDLAAELNSNINPSSRSATKRNPFNPIEPTTGHLSFQDVKNLFDKAEWITNTATHEEIVNWFNNSKLNQTQIQAVLRLLNDATCFVVGNAIETANNILAHRKNFEKPLADLQQKTEILDLSTADFTTADEGFDLKIRFNLDQKTKSEITGITLFGKGEDPETDGIEFARTNEKDTNDNGYIFTGKVNVGHDDETNETIYEDRQLVYTSVANTHNVGLRYSDFGSVTVNKYDEETQKLVPEQRMAFIGGYDTSKRIEAPAEETTFSGLATGGVTAVKGGERSGQFLALDTATNTTKDKVATLVFDGAGQQILTAKFDNWYDIRFTTDKEGDQSATFSNYNGTDAFKMVSDTGSTFTVSNIQYQEYEEGEPAFENGNPVTNNSINSEFRYYGDNGVANESVALIQIRDRGSDNSNYENINDYGDNENPRPEVRLNMGFGGVAK